MTVTDDPTHTMTGSRPMAPRIGESAPRPDGGPKTQGRFAFSSDLVATDMLWGHTVRSPHARARIMSIDTSAAKALAGVHCVLTSEHVPGRATFGLEFADQPVLASNEVRYQGEAVAIVAAVDADTARRAAEAVMVEYELIIPLTDPEAAITATPIHPDGNVVRHLVIRHGVSGPTDSSSIVDVDADPTLADLISVSGTYTVGMQDQAPLGTEAGLAIPADDGGIDLYVSTQWLHVDRDQVAASLGLPVDMVRLTLGGVGGAFGAREDCSLQIHLCLMALTTGRPVKMVYDRAESFVGHVHRHPAVMTYRHWAHPDGTIERVDARLVLDGGAYASSSAAVIANAACFAAGPYRVPHAVIDGWVVRTNNPPCGAMRGFGAVQTCFAHEAQMDLLADALGMDPVALRLHNALEPGDQILTGQVITGTAPVAEVIRSCAEAPLPARNIAESGGMYELPGGAGRTTDRQDVRRGTAFAVGFKNLMFSEGFDDFSTARIRIEHGIATVTCACAEVGQGFVTLAQQIVREILGIDRVTIAPADTSIGSAGSTSASRQTWMSGGAVLAAAQAIRARVAAAADSDDIRSPGFGDALVGSVWDELVEHHHAPTVALDGNGQGDAHVSFAFAAHRATVDVDVELGLVKLVDLVTSQDVGRQLNPLQLLGQLEGGATQGVGLALMEEIVVADGLVMNASFTDYLIPTIADVCDLRVAAIIEEPEPGAPFGAKGVGEPPTISSTAAVVAAVRAATGLALARTPVRPADIAFGERP